MIRMLLKHHAYIDAESPNGTTPLMIATGDGTAGAVKLLLEEGADPSFRNEGDPLVTMEWKSAEPRRLWRAARYSGEP